MAQSFVPRFSASVALAAVAAFAGALLHALPSVAQTYPSKPVRVIVPFAPGGLDASSEQGPAERGAGTRLRDATVKLAGSASLMPAPCASSGSDLKGNPLPPCDAPRLRDANVRESAAAAWMIAQASTPREQYPIRPVRVIVPFAPGGGSDLTARPVSQKLSEALGQQFVVDNRGGAAGIIGMELTARANPDGYTLMMMSGSFAATPATQKLSFDPLKEIVPIVELGYSPHVLVVHPSIAARTTTELIELVRAKPGTLPYASTGLGGFTHLGTELFASMAKLKMIHVPYKSTGAAMVDVLSGQCPFILGSLPGTVQHFQSGRLRALAVTSETRWPTVPELPTVTETLPGYTLVTWYGVMAPRGTPARVIQTINAEVNKILQASDMKKFFEVQGMAPTGGTVANFNDRIRTDYARWVKVVKEAGIKIN